MAIGDDATAAGIPLVASTDEVRKGYEQHNETRDIIAQRTNAVTPVTKGGTGSTTPSAARTALGIVASNIPTNAGNVQSDLQYLSDFKLTRSSAQYNSDFAARDSAIADRVAKSGDTMSGQLFLPNSFAASASWTVAYINGDGRVCRGSSSLRYKKFVSEQDPLELGNIFPKFNRFQMRADGLTPAENKWRYGPIAEEMAAEPDQEPFVVYRDVDGEVVPESVDFIGLLIAQNAQLHARLTVLEAHLTQGD